jgi:2-polyprenyl-6-methoxyphenol hydroxylase-like FAD-dependent oxidoreductase
MKPGFRVLIIGAGVAGLSTGIALSRTGQDVHIFERSPAIEPLGAGLVLWSNAANALRALGLDEELLQIGHRLSHFAILDQIGNTLSSTDSAAISDRAGSPTVSVGRSELIPLLMKQLPQNSIQTGRTFERADEVDGKVVAHFADGHVETGDLLIGADGIWSAVRSQIHGEQPARYSGYTAWRAVVDNPDPATFSTAATTESWGRGRRFGWVPLSGHRVYWFAVRNAPEGETAGSRGHRAELLELFADWHSPIPETIAATPEERILRHDIYDRPPVAAWGSGSITLAGDAAHPMTPNTGQGAAQAIEDAVVLADSLARYATIDGALRGYESVRIPRTRTITQISRRIGAMAQLENPLAVRIRDLVARLTPDSVGRRQVESIVNWTPPVLRELPE